MTTETFTPFQSLPDPSPSPSPSPSIFSHFLSLPLEIQILILRFYLPAYSFNITVSQSPIIPANFRIGTGCPFNFIFKAAGSRTDLCALWTSRDLHEPARKALEQSFDGQVNLQTPGFWHFPQRKPMFNAFVLPRLPAKMVRKIVLGVNQPMGTAPKAPRSYTSWRELVEFIDLQSMPNLESLQINMLLLGAFEFGIEQIGDLLRGRYDETVLEWVRKRLPPVRVGEKREIVGRDGKVVTVQVHTVDVLSSWVPGWKGKVSDSATDIHLWLEGRNTEDLVVKKRVIFSVPERYNPDLVLSADGDTWEAEAATRWPQLEPDIKS